MLYTRGRILAKSLTWRIMSTAVSFLLIWVITGNPLIAVNIAVINFFLKYILYYLHERVWEKHIKWGLKKPQIFDEE